MKTLIIRNSFLINFFFWKCEIK